MFSDNIGRLRKTYAEENIFITTDSVAEHIINAISMTSKEENIILGGDLNWRLDKLDRKTEIILDLLHDEGYKLIKKAEKVTYIAPNGKSTIDLVFIKGNYITVQNQEILYSDPVALLRKHIPVSTSFRLMGAIQLKGKDDPATSRKLNKAALEENKENLQDINQLIEKGHINQALEHVLNYIKRAHVYRNPRKGKPWFDAECYNLRRETLDLLHEARKTTEH